MDFDPDFDTDFSDLSDDSAAELERLMTSLDREGAVEAAFRAAVREELGV